MKKFLLTLVLLVGMVFGLMAQKLTYQAVVRDNNQQLVVNTAVKATVTIDFTTGNDPTWTVDATTNIHGLLSIEFGDDALNGRDWTGATIAVKVVNKNDESTVYVNGDARPVSAVPYALSVDGQSIQNYLTEHHYVNLDKLEDTLKAYSTTAAMDARHYLTSDSAVIKTMQSNITTNANSIANLTLHTAKAAIRDSVASQIHDSISNIAAKAHTHDNMAILNATEAPYTDADSAKLHDIADGAQKNVQSDWKQTDGSKDDYIKNKPSITDTVNNILTTGKYVTETTLDARHYLTSDSTVIRTMQSDIAANRTNISTNATNIQTNTDNIGNLILHTAKNAIRDSVAGQIHDSISNIAAKAHTHDNKDLLDNYDQTNDNLADAVTKRHAHGNADILNNTTATYTDADSIKLKGIEAGAQKNVQSDWAETNEDTCSFIRNKPELFSGSYNDLTNKPSITDTVNTILSTGGYVTASTLDNCHYLTSDSAEITTMQGHISTNKTNIQTNAGTISALATKEQSDSLLLAGRIDALEGAAMDCNKVKECIKDTLSKYTVTDVLNGLLQQLEARLTGKIDSLARIVDSLSNLTPGGGDTPTEVADGQPCPDAPTVSDGTNTYNTVKIGNQCWMKENLRTNVDGSVYPKKDNQTVTGEDTVTYGRLYTWNAMMKGAPSTNYPGGTTDADTIVQGICPAGWHVPSDAEWDTLTHYVYNSANPDYKCSGCSSSGWEKSTKCIAKALSQPTGWSDTGTGCNAGNTGDKANATGFSAVPAGRCFYGYFDGFGGRAYFWSATQSVGGNAWYRYLISNDSHVDSNYGNKDFGFSVRCLRD